MARSGHANHYRRTDPPPRSDTATYAVEPRIIVAESSTELVEWALARRDHYPHVAATHVHQSPQSVATIAASVLTAIGKAPDQTISKHRSEYIAAAWLLHGAATDVLLVEAQHMSGWLTPDLIRWFCGLGVTPWVIYGTYHLPTRSSVEAVSASALEVATEWGVAVEDDAALREAFPDREPQHSNGTARSETPALPMLPRCDGIVFRSRCADLLDPADAKRIDTMYVAAVADMQTGFADAISSTDRHKRRTISAAIRERLERQPSTEHVVLWARAAQIAGLHHGWHVKINTTLLCAGAEMIPRRGMTDNDHTWDRIERYREPDIGAVAALATAGFSWHDLPALRIDDIAEDGMLTVRHPGRNGDPVRILEPGAHYLRVLRTYRLTCGAESDDPLFASHRKLGVAAKFGYQLLDRLRNDTGIAVTDLTMGPKASDGEHWLARHGITLSSLANLPEPKASS